MVQGHAVDRLIELDALRAPAGAALPAADPFSRERRLEQRQSGLAAELPDVVPGYLHTPAAALAILAALRRRGAVLDRSITERIHGLCAYTPATMIATGDGQGGSA
jgi:hypothetical protein